MQHIDRSTPAHEAPTSAERSSSFSDWDETSVPEEFYDTSTKPPGESWDSTEKIDPRDYLANPTPLKPQLDPAETPPEELMTSPEAPQAEPEESDPPFILYKDGESFSSALDDLVMWVSNLLLPVYGREVSSQAPWCPRWWLHMEAVAQLYGLWMAWQELTGPKAPLTGPASWHRDFLMPVMVALRDASGPFAGCKTGSHRAKEPPQVDLV
ncbi:DUF4913 domain-containing protein [Streptomyces sp. NPDC055210]